MLEGTVVFSQKDSDDGLIELMENYAKAVRIPVSDLLKYLFMERLAMDLSYWSKEDVGARERLLDSVVSGGNFNSDTWFRNFNGYARFRRETQETLYMETRR